MRRSNPSLGLPRYWPACLAMLAVGGMLGGCSQPTPPSPSANLGKAAKTVVEDDVLPPQSEPPVAEESPTSEDPEMSEEKTEPANGSGEKSATAEDPEPGANESASNGDGEEDAQAAKGKVHVLFDGKNLDNWKRSNFGGEGEVEIVDDAVVMQRGQDMTGIHWTGEKLPDINYEVTLEAKRIDGSDFFCGIVFPVNDSFCSFVAGGWGGSVIGLSSIDDIFAAENETGTYASFDDGKWYKFRLRVSDSMITAWIDGKEYVRFKTTDRKLSVHPLSAPGKPFGVMCYATVAGVRDIKLRELTEAEIAADAEAAEEK